MRRCVRDVGFLNILDNVDDANPIHAGRTWIFFLLMLLLIISLYSFIIFSLPPSLFLPHDYQQQQERFRAGGVWGVVVFALKREGELDKYSTTVGPNVVNVV